jgi:putative FmdB family regulatory protein
MPIYEYEHIDAPCSLGRIFERRQSLADKQLRRCPECNQPVRKLISLVGVNTPKSNSELRDLGFTKLVKRDDGVYENVTARDGDSRYVKRGQSETLPDLSKTITD